MADIRNMQDVPFAMVERDVAQAEGLTLKAKGLYAVMVSYPVDWVFNMSHLASVSEDGMHATRSAFNELLNFGLVEKRGVRDQDGRWAGYEYVVTGSQFSDCGKPDCGKPDCGQSHTTNIDTTNIEVTNIENTKESLAEKVEKLRTAYNDNRGSLPEALKSKARDQKLANLIKSEGLDQSIERIAIATQFVANDSFWVERKYGLTNLLRHLDAKYEAARADQTPKQTVAFKSLADEMLGDEDV